ncbi:MAG: FtsX-like permease family protein [Gammaproteobacteria bacterium]
MSVRERRREHATLRALGFGPVRIVGLILGESLAIALLGGVRGVLFCYPAAAVFAAEVGTLFPVFEVSERRHDAAEWSRDNLDELFHHDGS